MIQRNFNDGMKWKKKSNLIRNEKKTNFSFHLLLMLMIIMNSFLSHLFNHSFIHSLVHMNLILPEKNRCKKRPILITAHTHTHNTILNKGAWIFFFLSTIYKLFLCLSWLDEMTVWHIQNKKKSSNEIKKSNNNNNNKHYLSIYVILYVLWSIHPSIHSFSYTFIIMVVGQISTI